MGKLKAAVEMALRTLDDGHEICPTSLCHKALRDALEEERSLIADANRYRWLRDRSDDVIMDLVNSRTWESVEDYKKGLDDLIDAEMAEATPECRKMAGIV